MRSTTRLLAVGAAAAAVLLGSASTAMADSQTIKDKRYDVLVGNFETGPSTLASKGTYHQHITSSRLDAKDLKVNHGKDFVSIRINMYKLDKSAFGSAGIRVNGGPDVDYSLQAAPDGEGGVYAESFPSFDGENEPSGPSCSSESTTKRIKGTSKTGTNGYIQVYVPRACLANPKLVSVGAASIYFDETVASKGFTSLQSLKKAAAADDFLYGDPIATKAYYTPKFSSWLARN